MVWSLVPGLWALLRCSSRWSWVPESPGVFEPSLWPREDWRRSWDTYSLCWSICCADLEQDTKPWMAEQNRTWVAEFILEGLSDRAEMKAALFVLLLLIYTITLLGNVGIIIVIQGDPRLHTSMYFFLSSLSIVDICFSSVVAPRTLVNFLSERKTISFTGCMGQAFFYIIFVTTECFLLAVMAYDRSNVINHFFCDVPPLLALSCASTYINEMILFSLAGVIELSTISTILVSYIFISFAILRIRSAKGRQKAFSTCASHLTAVTMLYGTTIFMYLRPSSSYSLDTDKVVSVFYTVVIPMLNPLIYSLRNQEVKDALRRTTERITVRL
nr:olfactory receptor 1052-like isoform X7 [Columba livia]